MVPANPPEEIEKVHIALDFSAYSNKAFNLGAEIADFTNAFLSCQYIHAQPAGYFPMVPGHLSKPAGVRRGKKRKRSFSESISMISVMWNAIPILWNIACNLMRS